MSTLTLTAVRIHNAIWEGIITGSHDGAPDIKVTYLDSVLEDITLTENKNENHWRLQISIPRNAISDGVQTFIISDANAGTQLGHFTLLAGDVLGEDMRAEVDLLRAELDMLKRAFRRHCTETT